MTNPKEIRIRAASLDDASAVHRAVLAAWAGTVDPRSSGHRLTEPEVADLLASGGGFVAELGGEVVGAVLWAIEGDLVELMKLAVVPPARKSGIAGVLIRAVEAEARRHNAAGVLLAVSAYSPGLVEWYEQRGYHVDPLAVYAHASPHSPTPTVLVRAVR